MVKDLSSVSNLAPARACSALLLWLCLCPIGAQHVGTAPAVNLMP